MEDKVLKVMNEKAPLNFEKATEIAEEFGLKPRAIVASAVRNGIEYEKKTRVGKTGAPVVRKEDLVGKIAEKFGVPVEDLNGLEKANKTALEALLR
jgi:LysM repeat protein